MTKARTRAQRRRSKAAKPISLPGGETVPQRPGQGARTDIERDPTATAVAARIRQGVLPRDALEPMAGDAVGRRLMAMHGPDAKPLFAAATHIRRTYHAYASAIGFPKRHGKCLSILAPPEAMTTHADAPPPDLRTADERLRQAVAAFMRLQTWLAHCDNRARTSCLRHVVDEPDLPITDWPGVVAALACVAEGLRGDRVTVRMRQA